MLHQHPRLNHSDHDSIPQKELHLIHFICKHCNIFGCGHIFEETIYL